MSNTPIEDTLLVAAHAQMRDEIDGLETIVTSGHQEKTVGYDTSIPLFKKIVFQFKRPHRLKSGNLKFHIDEKQRKTLREFAKRIGENSVYYALPLITNHSELSYTLEKLVFLKATEIEQNTTLIYIPEDFCNHCKKSKDDIEARVSGMSSPSIANSRAICWESLLSGIDDCKIGKRIYPSERQFDGDRIHYEIDLPLGGASATLFRED